MTHIMFMVLFVDFVQKDTFSDQSIRANVHIEPSSLSEQ